MGDLPMNVRLLTGLAAAATLALAFSAAAAPPPGCFYVRDVGDRSVGGPHTLYFKVKDEAHMHAIAYFHVETKGACDTSESTTEHAGFQVGSARLDSNRHVAMICKAEDLIVDTGLPCPIASIQRMTPEAVAALPRRIRP
jgi:hypothetical protein